MKHFFIAIILSFSLGCGLSDSINQNQVIEIANILHKTKNITEIDDCTRSKKFINGKQIRMRIVPSFDDSKNSLSKSYYYKDVLKAENISEDEFLFFTEKLKDYKLRHYYREGELSIFVQGGFLGDIRGIIVVHNSSIIPKSEIHLRNRYVISVNKKISENIYTFTGS